MFSCFKDTAPKQHLFYSQKITVRNSEIQSVQYNDDFKIIKIEAIDFITIQHNGDSNGFENYYIYL